MAADLFRVILPVDDMAEADAFWSRLLDLEVDPVVSTRHYLKTAGAILALVHPGEHGREHRPNPDRLYVRVPDLDATWEQARALGCPAPPQGGGAGISVRARGERSFYTEDPFGNPVCFVDDVGSETPPEQARYVGKPTANLYEVVLPTTSMGRADAFFEAMLELEVDDFEPTRHFFHCESCILALVDPIEHARAHALEPRAFRPNPEVTYFGVSDLEAAWERSRKLGMKPLPDGGVGVGIHQRVWGERSFYGLDPSGNPICVVDDQTLFTGSESWD